MRVSKIAPLWIATIINEDEDVADGTYESYPKNEKGVQPSKYTSTNLGIIITLKLIIVTNVCRGPNFEDSKLYGQHAIL